MTVEACLAAKHPDCALRKGDVYESSPIVAQASIWRLRLELNHATFQAFFCGYDPECRKHGSVWALEEAIKNIELHFKVVTTIERLGESLKVIETRYSTFLSGITSLKGTSSKLNEFYARALFEIHLFCSADEKFSAQN